MNQMTSRPERSFFLSTPRAREDLDRDYRAARFVPSLPDIVADWRAKTEEAKRCHAARLEDGLSYGPHERERIDLYRAQDGAGGPVLVFIHGGFWSAVSREESGFIVSAWTKAGVNVAVLDYALAPEVTLTTITTQALRGLAWLSREAAALGLDPKRIVVTGHSAGGHLAAMSQVEVPGTDIAGLALISGVFDLAPISGCYVNDTVRMTESEVQSLSPAYHWPRRTIPMLVTVGEHEPLGFHEQSRALAWAWRGQGCAGVLMLPGRNHFSILDDLADPESVIGKAIRRMLGDPARK
jgi:arylformamidase